MRFPEYTPIQIERIKEGIWVGRAALRKRGISSMVFFDAFAKAGGMQVPGRESFDESHLRILSSIVLMWADKRDYRLLKNWNWITDEIVSVIHREECRSLMEASMFEASKHPDAYAWRFCYSSNSADPEACRRLVECDNFGLGNGLFPLDEPIVFQPRYDRSWIELVFRDEIVPANRP